MKNGGIDEFPQKGDASGAQNFQSLKLKVTVPTVGSGNSLSNPYRSERVAGKSQLFA